MKKEFCDNHICFHAKQTSVLKDGMIITVGPGTTSLRINTINEPFIDWNSLYEKSSTEEIDLYYFPMYHMGYRFLKQSFEKFCENIKHKECNPRRRV